MSNSDEDVGGGEAVAKVQILQLLSADCWNLTGFPWKEGQANEKDEIFISLSAFISTHVLFHGGGGLRHHILISSGGESW